MKLSICIPVYNGSETIDDLISAIEKDLSHIEYEIVMVNDGSLDNSEKVCVKLSRKYNNIVFLSLRKNFGQHNAQMCALNHCKGDYAVFIDDDLQNPPSEIVKLLDEVENGFDVVYSRYARKKHNLFRNFGSRINDIFSNWLLNKPKDLYLCNFKILRRGIINEVIKYKGPFPYIDGLILRSTNNVGTVLVDHNKREAGKSNYTLAKLVSLWLNMFINFSIKPMRIITLIGLVISLSSALLAITFFIKKLINPELLVGWTSLVLLILFFGGIQSFFLGIIGEYIAKNYLDNNKTPQWVIKDLKEI